MFKRQATSASVSPAWAFAQWSLRRKLAAAVVLPVGLSFALGGVAVKSDFDQARQLAAAADATLQVRPVVEYNLAVQALAAAESVGGGGVISAITKYESAAANLRIALKSDAMSAKVKADAEQALALGNAVRSAKTQQSFSATVIDKSANTASLSSTMVGDLALTEDAASAKAVVTLQDSLAAQRAMTGQQLNLANETDAAAPVSAVKQVGAEASFLSRLQEEVDAANAADVRQLINENGGRGLSLGAKLDTSVLTAVGEGYERSNAAYSSMIDRQLTALETALRSRADEHRTQAKFNASLVAGALLAALFIVVAMMQSLLNPIRAVRRGALDVAQRRLPEAVARIRDGEEPETFEPIPVHTTEEMGQLARAVDDLHTQALTLAGEQARLRVQFNSMFETLSRRSTSLVDQQLSLIERLERDEQDPKRLQSLFRLDHLAARMRRNSDSLLVLAGTTTRRGMSGSVSIADVVRAAVSEVENYERIDIGETSDDHVLGSVGSDLIHLLAEIVDNALAYSPPTSRVKIRGARTPHGGLLVEVTDRGLGMPAQELAALNERLATGGEITADTARRMGLFVVGNLAARHGVLVRLRRNADKEGGITVAVQLPAALLESRGAPAAPDATAGKSKPGQQLNGHAQPARPVPGGHVAAPASAPPPSLEPLVVPAQESAGRPEATASGLPKRAPGQQRPGAVDAAPAPAGLPKRVPGQQLPGSAEPVPAAQAAQPAASGAAATPAGLPKRVPGQQLPGSAEPTAIAAAPIEPTQQGEPTQQQGELTQQGEPAQQAEPTQNGEPAQSRRHRGLTGLIHTLRGGSGAQSSDAEDPSDPADSPRSKSGLPMRRPNATRITELTGGPVTRPEGTEPDPDAQPRMPANLSAWLDHRAALAAARAAREAEEAQAAEAAAGGIVEAASPERTWAVVVPVEATEPGPSRAEAVPVEATEPEPTPAEAVPVEAAEPEPTPAEAVPLEAPKAEERLAGAADVDAVTAEEAPDQVTVAVPEPTGPEAAPVADSHPRADEDTTQTPERLRETETPLEPVETENPVVTTDSDAAAPDDSAAPVVTRLPVRTPGATGAGNAWGSEPAASPSVPHRSQATAYLGARKDETRPGGTVADTPIFRSMMSNWLTDSSAEGDAGWSPSEADAGWSAAEHAESAQPVAESEAGLPMRRPGEQLVPGGIEHAERERISPAVRARDPEAIRRNLNRHHRGVSSARAETQDASHPREEADVHN